MFALTESKEIDTQSLVLLQMRLECKGVVDGDLLVRIAGPYPDDIANYSLIRTASDIKAYYNARLPESVRNELRTLQPNLVLSQPTLVSAILKELYPAEGSGLFRSYTFPRLTDPASFAEAVLLKSEHSQLFIEFEPESTFPKTEAFGILADGRLVSVCESSREDDQAGEAWVRTLPQYRGRGFAKQTALAWAANLIKQGKTPFYSHKVANLESSGVAKGLGLIPLFEQMNF